MTVLLLPACTGEGDQGAGIPSPAATESRSASAVATADGGTTPGRPPARPTPTPTEPASSAEDRAAAAAIAALETYLDVLNELSLDRGIALAELESVATDGALEWATYTISAARDQGWTVTGERTFEQIDVARVQLDPAESQSGYPAVRLDACLDSTGVDALDEAGDSVLPPARPTRLATHWSVWRIGGAWVVAETGFIGDTVEAAPCA